jgi:hypothetical protein
VIPKNQAEGKRELLLGPNPNHEDAIPMIQADSVHSTPPTNTPISQADATSRRRFLSNAASAAAGGAVLALAVIPPAPAADALAGAAKKPEAILGLIADHKAAILATDDALRHYGDLEQTIPDDRRKGDFFGGVVEEKATDDPRWTAACHRFCDSFRKSDDIALAMLDAPINSIEALAALIAYSVEHSEKGLLWPEDIVDDDVDGKRRDWDRWVLIKAAATIRSLSSVGWQGVGMV